MSVDTATFEILAEPPMPDWIVRVTAQLEGYEIRAVPLVARVGDVPVVGLRQNHDLTGFVGYLTTIPPDGAHLFVGYADDLQDTGIAFEAPPIV